MEKYNHEYNAEQIQVLEGLEAVRKRPGMYIGSVSIRGLHHLVYEIVDNCVDEALAGYCTHIHIIIEKGNIISVEDDGRGIPVDIHPKTHISAAETVYTVLHAGGKFGGDSGYKVSGGLHGVGASVVNALSEWVEVTIQRDGGIYEMKFQRGKTTEKLTRLGDSKKTGTKVRFLADSTIFETLEYDFGTLEERFREIAFLNKGLHITIEDQRNDENLKKSEFCFEGGLISFVEFLNQNKEKIHPTPIYIEKDGEVPVEIALQYTTAYTENIYTFVNNINTIEGGTHLEGFKRGITKVFNDYARAHNILKEKDSNLLGEDIREGMTAVISVKVKEPQFEGQTKTKLGNSVVTGIVQSMVVEVLAPFLEENPSVAKAILEKCISASRASVQDAAVLTALDCLDELSKANQNIENIRTQIKDYVDDAGRARSQADEAQKEIRELQAKVHDLEEQLEARTVVKREPEDEVINANELLSQEIKNAIERPVHPNQPNNGNFVGTVNYRPEGGSH